MSVLVSKRRESKAEYVNNARELLVKVLQQVKKLPKSITFYITQDVVKFARKCFKKDLRKIGKDGYCLLIDFKSYFANIDHNILLDKLKRLNISNDILELIGYLLKLYDEKNTEKGLALGSQMSQSFALYYASDIDNYVYHYKHVLTYGRYMDDIYILSKSKRKLQRLLVNIKKIAKKDNIIINEKKD